MTGFESGHQGQLVSLSGFSGRPGRGRVTRQLVVAFNASNNVALPAELGRLWAVLSNDSAVDVYVSLGDPANVSEGILLRPGGTLQIDDRLPWTGQVQVASAGAGNVLVVECSIGEYP